MASEAKQFAAFNMIRRQAYENANQDAELGRTAARLLAECCGPFIMPSGSNTLYLLDSCQGMLIEFDKSDKEFGRLLIRLDLPFEKKAISAMIDCARGLALEADVHRIGWYDQDLDTAYIYSQGTYIYAISANGIRTIVNGTDHIYFLREPDAKPFKFVADQATDHDFKNLLETVVKPASGLVSPDYSYYMLIIWFCCLFLAPLIATMPVLLLVGPSGSNKSLLLRLFNLLLTGTPTAAVRHQGTRKVIDFALSTRGFAAIDDMTKVPQWLMERIEGVVCHENIIMSPGSGAKANRTLQVDCRLAAASRDIPESIMERLGKFFVVELDRKTAPRTESSIVRDVVTNRNVIMTSVILLVQKIIRSFDDANGEDYSGPFQCSDLANVATRLARRNHPQGEQFVSTGLERLASVTTHASTSSGQTIIELMKMWVPEHVGKKFRPKELHSELEKVAEQHGMTLEVTDSKFGHTLNRLANNIESLFRVNKEKLGGNYQYYSFWPKG